MKKILLILLLSSCFINAQTPIYKFEFNNNVSDATNSSINFVSSAASSTNYYTIDRFGNGNSALTSFFDNAVNYTANLPNIPLGNTPRTVSVWVSYQGFNVLPAHVDVFNYGNQSNNQRFGLRQLNNSIRAYGWGNDLDTPTNERFQFNNLEQSWYHYVMTFDGSNVKVYRNGHLVLSGNKPEWNTNGSQFRLNVGSPNTSGAGVSYDDLEIYDVVLTEQQIKNMYIQQAGNTLLNDLVAYFSFDDDFTSSNGNHAFTYVNPPASFNEPHQVSGYFGNGYFFNESMMGNETLSPLVNTDNVSFTFWSKRSGLQSTNTSLVGLFNGFNFIRNPSNENNVLVLSGNAANNQLQGFANGFPEDILNEWTHHAVVFVKPFTNSETRILRYYNNGVLVRTLTINAPMYKVHNKVSLGRSYNDTGSNHNGFFTALNLTVLDELLIFNKALTQTEILALSFMDASALSQPSCPTGNVTITSQAEADALAGCTHITGNLSIFMNYNVLDFTPLQNITTIDGSFTITELGNTGVLNILPNLTTIGGNFAMYGNDLITSVEGFSSITSLDGIVVSGSFNLTTFNAFQNLQSVNYITVGSCQNLTTIQPFNQLTAFNNLRIEFTALTNLNFLSNVSTVLNNPFYNSITLENNNNLSDISALNGLTVSNFTEFDEIKIQNNPLLATCAVDLVCSYLASPDTNKTIANNATGCESVAVVNAACEALSNTDFTLNQFSFYPNPSNSIFNVEVVNDSVKTISVVDLMGKVVAISNVTTVDVSNLASGLYLVQIQTESGKTATTKLIKN
jgi:hypothetical protein